MTEPNPTKKVLVIDDDPTDVRLISSLLTSLGHEVVTAADAPAGVELAMSTAPDLIVLDVMMPIINGFNICRLLKSHTDCGYIPIILVTSRATEDDIRIGQEAGADLYITKPVDRERFVAAVSRLLAGGKGDSGAHHF